ncbi:hypothetical protein MMC08_002533 [Hypocenomyce scalaris]|nr:hypothetical protein [Hypocenomyce scalaris]
MPLSEISSNSAGRKRTAGSSIESPSNGTIPTLKSSAQRKADFKPTPSSLQAMLKNTTETGNVGQFSIKPTRIPYPTTRRASQRQMSSDTRASAQRHPEQHRESEQAKEKYIPFRSYRDTTASSVISLYQSESQKSLHVPSETDNQDYHSYSMTQSSRNSYSVSNQRSFANLRAPGELTRSPLAYPTRLKRPGYRPSSPALSDFSRSVPSLVNPPSAFIPRHDRAQRMASALIRVPTPTPLACRQNAGTHAQDQWARSVPNLSVGSRQVPSSTPLYYDYTEAFEEESLFHSTSVSVESLVDQPIPKDRPVNHELDGNLTSNPIELPVHSSASTSSSSRSTYSVTRALPLETSRGMPRHALDDGEIEVSLSAEKEGMSGERSQATTLFDNVEEFQSNEKPPVLFESFRKDLAVGCSTLSSEKSHSRRVSSPNSSHTARSMVIPSTFFQSSHPVSSTTDSLDYSKSKIKDAQEGHPSNGGLLRAAWKIPSLNFSRLDFNDRSTHIPDPSGRRVLSTDGLAEPEYEGIYAPMPERSLSSRSHQNKYSRILSIDEDRSELAELATTSEGADKLQHPNRIVGDSKSFDSITNRPRSRSPIQTLSGLARQPSAVASSVAYYTPTINRDCGEDEQRDLSELIRQSLLWQDSHSVTSSAHTATSNGSIHPQHVSRESSSEAPAESLSEISPGPIKESAIVSTDHKEPASRDNRKSGAISKRSHAQLMKKLPPLPRDSFFRSFTPPNPSRSAELPCDFSPSITDREGTARTANVEASLGPLAEKCGHYDEAKELLVPKYKLKMRPNRELTASPPASRPWNINSSYPWSNQSSEVDLRLPEPARLPHQPLVKSPRFKLKVTRASIGTVRVKKQAASPKSGMNQRAAKPIDLFRSLRSGRRSQPRLPKTGTTGNGSHRMKTRFAEAVDGRPSTSGNANLVPPLSTLQFTEARSFFSDDSSQILHKGSLRKRLSHIKAIATRNSSSDEGKAVARGPAGSAMGKSGNSGQTSQQSGGATVGISNLKYVRWKMMERIKLWWQRGEEKIRALSGIVKGKDHKSRSENTDLYPGV